MSRGYLSACSFCVLACSAMQVALAVPSAAPGAQHLEVTSRHRLLITYDYSAVWPQTGGGSATFYLPMPPSTGSQRIDSFRSSLPGQPVTDADNPPRRILHGTVHHGPGNERRLDWRIKITGTFITRQLGPGPSAPGRMAGPGGGSFLGTSDSLDWRSAAFQRWLDGTGLRRSRDESPAAYGRRLYDYMTAHGDYTYLPQGGWIASGAARRLHTDCGGLSLVFTAACRANRIPARLLVGEWFKTGESGSHLEQAGKQSHVITEFFDPTIGWIPVDVSSALLRVPGHGDYDYFGRDPGFFFAWHFDTDFHFDVPGKENGHVQWIQNPSPWFSPDAASAAESSAHHWHVESLD